MQELFKKYPINSEINLKYSDYETEVKIVQGYEQIEGEQYLITDNGRISVRRLEMMEGENERLKSRTCQSCANKGKCAIFDNFNIDYCSDWKKGKVEE